MESYAKIMGECFKSEGMEHRKNFNEMDLSISWLLNEYQD